MEWRSKKQLDEYIFSQNRNEVISWVSDKTLKKWGIELNYKGKDTKYILQKGNKFFIVIYGTNTF